MKLVDKKIKKQLSELYLNFPNEKITEYSNWSKLTTIGVGNGVCVTIEPSSEDTLVKLLKYTSP